ncbi:MAG: NUDIX domain-containing protein [Planctomycetota bacterium]|jgi:8-oxo-dGTP diphosphatase
MNEEVASGADRGAPTHSYAYARPAVTVDLVVLTDEPRPKVLLIQRDHAPFAGEWALPGGFVDKDERLEDAAARELVEETAMSGLTLRQFGAYGDPGRDPRGWTVAIAFLAAVPAERTSAAQAGDDARAADWFFADDPPELAFDHARILRDALACEARAQSANNR